MPLLRPGALSLLLFAAAGCWALCGDHTCDLGEDCVSCPSDCPLPCGKCGDLYCDTKLGENCTNCATDCFCPKCLDGSGVCDFPARTCTAYCGDSASPVPVSAVLAYSPHSMTITFSPAVTIPTNNTIDPALACSYIFDSQTLTALGPRPACYWPSSTELAVAFTGTIKPGTILRFTPTLHGETEAQGVLSTVRVTMSEFGLKAPEAVIHKLSAGSCDPIHLDAALSSGAVSYKWFATPVSPVTANVPSFLPSDSSIYVSFDADIAAVYSITLVVSDEYGMESVDTVTVQRASLPSGVMGLNAKSEFHLPVDREYTLVGTFREARCPTTNSSWVRWTPLNWTITPLPNFTDKGHMDNIYMLMNFPEYSLTAGQTYTVNMSISNSVPGYEEFVRGWTIINIIGDPEVPRPIIYGGDRLVELGSVVKLGLNYLGRARPTNTATFTWTCVPFSGNQFVLSGESVSFTASSNTTTCALQISSPSFSKKLSVTISAISPPNGTRVVPVAITYPDTIYMNERPLFTVDTNASSLSWTILPSIPASLIGSTTAGKNLVLSSWALDPATKYTIRVTSKEANTVGFAETTFTTTIPPFGGTMYFPNETGYATCSDFYVRFDGWNSWSGRRDRLTYALFYEDADGDYQPLRWFESSSEWDNIKCPLGILADHKLVIHGAVKDEFGYITYTTKTIQVLDSLNKFLANGACLENLESSIYRNSNNLDISMAYTAVFGSSFSADQMAYIEKLWAQINPAFYDTYFTNFRHCFGYVTYPEMLYRVAQALGVTMNTWRKASEKFHGLIIDVVQTLATRALTLGMGKSRELIHPLLQVYDSTVKYYLTNTTDTAAKTNALALLTAIQNDLKNHVCGEIGSYTSETVGMYNIKQTLADTSFNSSGVSISFSGGSGTGGCVDTAITIFTDGAVVDNDLASLIVSVTTADNSSDVILKWDPDSLKKIDPVLQKYQCVWKNALTGGWEDCPTNSSTGSIVCMCPSGGQYGIAVRVPQNPSSAPTLAITNLVGLFLMVVLAMMEH